MPNTIHNDSPSAFKPRPDFILTCTKSLDMSSEPLLFPSPMFLHLIASNSTFFGFDMCYRILIRIFDMDVDI